MKKWLIGLLVLVCAVLCIFFFFNQAPKGETNLEFWIAQQVEREDFSGHEEKYGLMGGREYYGSGYVPTTGADGWQTDPDHCVIYTVTAYPDYSSRKQHVTRIYITDPAVTVYGLTVNSSQEEIAAAMAAHGFHLKTYENAYGLTYTRGKFTIRFANGQIAIGVKVSNLLRIQF